MSDNQFRPVVLRARGDDGDPAEVVRQWWARLADDPQLLREGETPFPNGVRAGLRRAATPDDALLTEGFRHLWLALPATHRSAWEMRAWGSVAVALAQVRTHDPEYTFARAMGRESDHGTGKPVVSELRFQQLLRSDGLDDLLRRARRAVTLLRKHVHVLSLADDLLHWHQEQSGKFSSRPDRRLAVRWANDYFTELATYEKTGKAS